MIVTIRNNDIPLTKKNKIETMIYSRQQIGALSKPLFLEKEAPIKLKQQ